ncbi:MAG: hypothetical protein PSV16_00600 [Flavobacterium sp.]|nr:hypothetical protein [Flavobacterium sp.]
MILLTSKIAAQSGFSSFEVLPNLYIKIAGNFDNEHPPKWQFINTSSELTFELQNNVARPIGSNFPKKEIILQADEGHAILGFSAYVSCYCSAEIDIPNKVTLNETPRTFALRNFQKLVNGIPSGQPCVALSTYTQGGWDGEISLSANDNGKITMQLILRNKARNGQYAYIYTGNAVMANLTPPQIPINTNPPAQATVAPRKVTGNSVAEFDSNKNQVDDNIKLNKTKYDVSDSLKSSQNLEKGKGNNVVQEPTGNPESKEEEEEEEGLFDWFARIGAKTNNALAPLLILIAVLTFYYLVKDRNKDKK